MFGKLQTLIGSADAKHMSPMLRVALTLGVIVHLAGFFLFHVESNPLPIREENPAFINYLPIDDSGEDAEFSERASLFDSAPLFIPDEWSSASAVFTSNVVRDWQVFPDFESKVGLRQELLDELSPERSSLPFVAEVTEPADLLDLRFWDLLENLGTAEIPVVELNNWNSVAEVSVIDGEKEFQGYLDVELEMDLSLAELLARPVVYTVNLSAPGSLVGAPVLSQSSGSEELDAVVLEWLMRPSTLAKLPAGFLKLRVFPQ